MATHPVIDPLLTPNLAALLQRNEVPETTDALLWEFEKRGYWLYLAGPDEERGQVGKLWEASVARHDAGPTQSRICYGQTARIALARLYQWVREQEGDETG